MSKLKLLLPLSLVLSLFLYSCSDDDKVVPTTDTTTGTGDPQDTTVVTGDGYILIHNDPSGDATINTQQGPVSGGLDGTMLEYIYNDTADEVTFRVTVTNLVDFSTSPSFDFSFQLPNGTVPMKLTGLPFRGTTMTHRTASVYTDDGGSAPSNYTYNQTNQFAINGMGYTGEFGNPPQLMNLKNICEDCIDFRLDISNNQIYATIDRNLIIKNEEIDSISDSASIKIVANVGYQRGNNDLIADGEEFGIRIMRNDTTVMDTNMTSLANVSTTAVNNVNLTTAEVSGNVVDEGSSPVTVRGICYSESTNPTINDFVDSSGSGLGNYTITLQNLKKGTSYFARAYATSSVGTAYGSELIFKTLIIDTIPTVTTQTITNITNSSAYFTGVIQDDGNRAITERGFVISESPNPNIDSNFRALTGGTGIGTFGRDVTKFPSNTTFFVKAYAINNLGVGYGNEVQFTTTDSTTRPTALTTSAVNITQTSAYCGVRVVDNGNDPITEAGLVYSTSPNPDLTDNVLMVPNVGPNAAGYGVQMNNLTSGTTYYFRGYAKNSFGVDYGQEIIFNTLP